MALLGLLALVLGVAAWAYGGPLWRELVRERIRRRPFSEGWRQVLRRRMPYFRSMPADLQLQLKRHVQVFLAEKPFIGCAGLEVTEEMRVTIAAQACLLLLNRRRPSYFPNLRQVLVYPAAFAVNRVRTDASGIVQDERRALSGESWSQGQVIVSWADAVDGAAHPADGRNVVIHEFAHQLDQQDGAANGAPALVRRADRERWAQVMGEAFSQLRQQLDLGEETLLDPYGATDPAEFFAVASEVFFEQPFALAGTHPALFGELSRLYRVNPLSW